MPPPLTPTMISSLAADGEGGELRPQETEKTRFATGFDPLDALIDNGFGPGDLVVIGGRPGAGKSIAALQWARHIAMSGHPVVYACYQHDPIALYTRLVAVELASHLEPGDGADRRTERHVLVQAVMAGRPLPEAHRRSPELRRALDCLRSYGRRLGLLPATGEATAVDDLARVEALRPGRTVLFVDYVQRVAPPVACENEAERATRVAHALKDLALGRDLAVVAVCATDRAGLAARRLRLHHLGDSPALAHEADVVVLLNDHWATDPAMITGPERQRSSTSPRT